MGRDQVQDSQAGTSSQAGQTICYFCRQPGHMRRDYPRRQRSVVQRLSVQISLICRVRFYSCTWLIEWRLNWMHLIHSLIHLMW